MNIKVLFGYVKDVVPPRCRKSRTHHFDDGVAEVSIPEVTNEQAPVAIRSTCKVRVSHDDVREVQVDYRYWGGQLWTSVRMCDAQPRGMETGQLTEWDWPAIPSELDLRCKHGPGRNENIYAGFFSDTVFVQHDECMDLIRQWSSDHLIVDGVFYRPAGEPRYVVLTFGLGCNHGGTVLMVDSTFNPNIRRDFYFNLFELDKAIEFATKVAESRGDTKNIPMRVNGPKFEVLMPAAIKVPSNDVKFEQL